MSNVTQIVVEDGRYTVTTNGRLITVTVPDGPHNDPQTILVLPAEDAPTFVDLITEATSLLARLQA